MRLQSCLIAIVLVFAAGSSQVQAVNLFWSGNGTTQGGAGTWNTADARWGTSASGPYDQVWNNTNVDSAEFGATAGTVNLGGPVVVNTITTTLAGVAIGNTGTAGAANTITFSGANAGVNTTTTGTTTINAVMNGTIIKSGPGRLEMGNIGTSQPSTNKYVIDGGVISTASDARIGAAPGSLVQDFITFNGGGWAITTGNQSTGANKGVTIKSGGAFFGSSSTTINLTIASPIVGTEGGGITLTNVGPFVGNGSVQVGAVVMLTNTSNSWDGNVTIASGTLRVGAAGVIPDTAVVSLAAGTRFDLTTFAGTSFDETVKTISGTGGTVAAGTATLTVADPNGESHAGVISASTGGKIIKNGSGAWTLSGSSTGFNGEFVMNAGTLGVGSTNIFGNAANTSSVTINGGVLSNTGTGGRSIPAPIALSMNADFTVDDSLFNSSTPGQILFNGNSTIRNSDRIITVNGTANLGLGGASGSVGEDAAGRSLTKNGAGTLALLGINTYSGGTTINGGTINIDGDGTLGNGAGTLTLNGGRLNATANRSVSTDPVPNQITLTADSAITTTSTAGTVNLNLSSSNIGGSAGTLTFRNDAASGTGQFDPRFSGTFTFNRPIVIDNFGTNSTSTTRLSSFNTTTTGSQTFTGVISGNGSYRRSAGNATEGGTTIFTAANTYSGGTNINEGTVLANNSSGSATGPGAVFVGDGNLGTLFRGMLGGTGSVGGAITVREGGTLAPGTSVGTLTAASDVTFADNGHFAVELSGSLADQLVVGGNLDLSSTLDFLDVTGSGAGPWVIATYAGTLTGTFNSVTSGYAVNYGSGTNSQITLNVAVGVPGDFNQDNKVDAADYVTWRTNGEPNTPGAGPLPNDGGAADQNARITLWRANFGNPGAGGGLGGTSAVPEPASVSLVLAGIAMLAFGRRRGC